MIVLKSVIKRPKDIYFAFLKQIFIHLKYGIWLDLQRLVKPKLKKILFF